MKKLVTVKDFKDAGLEFAAGDKSKDYSTKWTTRANHSTEMDHDTIKEFAWRTNAGFKPEFNGVIEVQVNNGEIFNSELNSDWNWSAGHGSSIKRWRPLITKGQPQESKPIYTQAMADAGELPPIGSECVMINKDLGGSLGAVGKVEFKNELGVLFRYKENNLCDFCEHEETKFKAIDTRTDKERLRDAMVKAAMLAMNKAQESAVIRAVDGIIAFAELTKEYTITLNK